MNIQYRSEVPIEGYSSHTPMKKKRKDWIRLDITEGEGSITVVKIIDDDKCAIGFTSGDLVFYDIENYKPLCGHREHTGAISTMEIAEIGIKTKMGIENKKILLTGGSESECSVLVWDLLANEPLKRLSGHDHLISSIIDLGDGATIATASFDSKVAIWDLSENFNCIQLLEEPTSPILCLDFNKDDNTLCTGGLDGTVNIWQVYYENGLYHGCAVKNKIKLGGHVIEISRSINLPNMLITLESDFTVRLYCLETAFLLKSFKSKAPFVDFMLVERPNLQPFLYCLDNENEIHRFEDWKDDGKTEYSKLEYEDEGDMHDQEKVSYIKQFFGYSPKS
jgi:WD40 repeat protein